MRPGWLAIPLLAVAMPVAAGQSAQPATVEQAAQPASLPTRDVDVSYRSQPGDAPIEQRSRFSAALQRARLDLPTPGLFSIMDYRTHTMSLVNVAERKVLQTTGRPPGPTQFVRRGQDQVAGLPCTEWEAADSAGQPALTCFTADGVLLRVRRGTQVLAAAIRVVYEPQDAALFQVPAEFERVQRRPAP